MINADALTHTRTERGFSQRKLALAVGLNYQVIRRLEGGGDDGNLTLREFAKICEALGVAPTVLLSEPATIQDAVPADPTLELDLGQARLLRRIQRGEEVRRSLTREQQELVLPSLLKLQLVRATRGGVLTLSRATFADFEDPDSHG